jgi:ribose transport system permease protein
MTTDLRLPRTKRASVATPTEGAVKIVQRVLSPQNAGAVYVLVAICIVFSFWAPSTFPEFITVKQIFNGNAINLLAALGLILPLSCGVFDLSQAYTMSLTGVVAAYLVANHGYPLWLAIVLALLVAIFIGFVNVLVIVRLKIDSFIGTLATGSLIQAGITMVSHDNSINANVLTAGFSKVAQGEWVGFTLPVFYALGLAVIVWYLFGHTATGRRMYATGFNNRAARLAGVRTDRLQMGSLLVGSFLAGLTGIVLASSIGAGDPTVGTPYLLSTFAAVFLGATQIKRGRFNAVGTIIAVVLLGTGVTGLGLANAPEWTGSMFIGVVLIAALGISGLQRRRVRTESPEEPQATEVVVPTSDDPDIPSPSTHRATVT